MSATKQLAHDVSTDLVRHPASSGEPCHSPFHSYHLIPDGPSGIAQSKDLSNVGAIHQDCDDAAAELLSLLDLNAVACSGDAEIL